MQRNYLKYKPVWVQLIIFVGIVMVSTALINLIALPITATIMHVKFENLSKILSGEISFPNLRNVLIVMQTISVFSLFIIPSLVYAYFADPNPNSFLGLNNFSNIKFISKSVLLVFVGIFAIGLLGILNKQIPLPQYIIDLEKKQNANVETLVLAKNIKDLIINVIVVGLFAAISEELFFRGVLQRIFIQMTKNPWWGIIITSIIFSAIHMQFSGFLVRMGLGIILGALYWYSRSIWINILFHFIYNSLGVIAAYMKPETLQQETPFNASNVSTLILGIIGAVAVIFIIAKMKKDSTTSYAKIFPKEPDFFVDELKA